MTVDQREVNQMAHLISIMNGSSNTPTRSYGPSTTRTLPPAQKVYEGQVSPPVPMASLDAGVAAMRNILLVLQDKGDTAINKATRKLVQEGESDPQLRNAMRTEVLPSGNGVSIGDWTITKKVEGKRKRFDVAGSDGRTIASDLTLYEAAFGIAQALADGQPITTPKVRAILRAEEEYAAALNDAIHHRHALVTKGRLSESRRNVTEDRYDVAKQRAATARASVLRLVGPLPF